METKWCWVQEALREGRFVLRKALTEENEADIGTKWLGAPRLLKLLMAMNMRRISGPVLAALVIADQIATMGATSAEVGRQCRCNGLLVMVGALLTTTMVLSCGLTYAVQVARDALRDRDSRSTTTRAIGSTMTDIEPVRIENGEAAITSWRSGFDKA